MKISTSMTIEYTENSITIPDITRMDVSILHSFSPAWDKWCYHLAFRRSSTWNRLEITLLYFYVFKVQLSKHPFGFISKKIYNIRILIKYLISLHFIVTLLHARSNLLFEEYQRSGVIPSGRIWPNFHRIRFIFTIWQLISIYSQNDRNIHLRKGELKIFLLLWFAKWKI